jgi:hypothetical protein
MEGPIWDLNGPKDAVIDDDDEDIGGGGRVAV